MTEALAPVLKWPGAKWRLAGWITERMPTHEVYLEPFLGSGAVFFSKAPAKAEILNDLDGRVVNLFRVIRERPGELAAAVEMTPWSRQEYYASYAVSKDPLEDARRFLVRSWQSHGIKLFHRTGWRCAPLPTNRGRSYVGDWDALPPRILATARRLRMAEIECRPYEDLLDRFRSSEVLVYADPPYLLTTSNAYYKHPMTEEEHATLLGALSVHPGPVLLSGYRHPLYQALDRAGWASVSRIAKAEKGREREECLWINPVAQEAMEGRLF